MTKYKKGNIVKAKVDLGVVEAGSYGIVRVFERDPATEGISTFIVDFGSRKGLLQHIDITKVTDVEKVDLKKL